MKPEPPSKVVIDALQVAPRYSGVGREVSEIGEALKRVELPVPLEVRCAADLVPLFAERFPEGTGFHTPLRTSRPAWRRVAYQQLLAPFRDGRGTLLVTIGEQAPVWGRAPLIFLINDVRRISDPASTGSAIERRYYSAVLRRGARRAWRILTISRFTEAEIHRVLRPTAEVRVVSVYPSALFSGTVSAARIAASRSTTFLNVGAIRRYKGLETIVEATSLLDQWKRTFDVVCVGDGEGHPEWVQEVRELAGRLGVSTKLRMAGWVSDEELRGLYRSCLGTVNPSLHEGYGLGVAESLANGVPTIASDIPPHREIGGDAAIYFEPGDAAGLAAAMATLLREAEVELELSRKAVRRARVVAADGRTIADELLAAFD
jgi:glycosyltransferase involved in cell wall biosynthesis